MAKYLNCNVPEIPSYTMDVFGFSIDTNDMQIGKEYHLDYNDSHYHYVKDFFGNLKMMEVEHT